MASSGRSEETEVLCQHIDTVTSKMEQILLLFSPGSDFVKCFDSGEGKTWATYVQQYTNSITMKTDAPKVPSGSSMNKWLASMYPKINKIAASIKYIGQWATLSIYQLKLAIGKIIELDIRWNQNTTITLCKIFVQLVKVMLFFNQTQLLRNYALIVANAPSKEFVGISNDFPKILHLMDNCTISPFHCLAVNIEPIKGKMARLASNIGTFIAKLFGVFPLIEWEPFSIFTKRTAQPESMLPADEFIILQNISLFKETLFFFLMTFPDTTSKNECFGLIVEALLSEIPVIPITRLVSISLDDFLKLCPSDVFNKTLLNAAILQTKRKFNTSHIQRIIRVTILLEDILNICKFNISLLPPLMNFITALGGLAYYELDTCFYFKEPRNEAMHLLSVITDIAELIRLNFNYIQRFFLFNIASTDTQYLERQLSQAVVTACSTLKEVDMSKLITDILSSLLALDLEQFDKGYRYEFTPLLVTHSHYLFKFAEIKTRERVSFLDPIFEHLSVIRDHIAFATNPIQAFLNYVPLHTMWNHLTFLGTIIRGTEIQINYTPSVLKMFTFFSYDTCVLRQLGIECQNVVKKYSEIRGHLFLRITQSITQKIDSESPEVRILMQTHSFLTGMSGFKSEEFSLPKGSSKKKIVLMNADNIEKTQQIGSFFERVPQSVVLLKNPDYAAGYYANNITENLTRFMFPSDVTPSFYYMDMAFTASTTFIWPLFTALGSSFQRRLFEYRLRESSYPNQNKLDAQIQSMLGLRKEDTPINNNTLILRIERTYVEFISKKFKNCLYIPPLKGFWGLNNSKDSCQFFTLGSIEFLIRSLGINAGFRINKLLTMKCVEAISSIFRTFCDLEPQINSWYDDNRRYGNIKPEIAQNPHISVAVENMQRLGVCLALRSLLREAIKKIVDRNLPGLTTLIDAAVKRKENLDPREVLIREMLCGDTPEVPFIRTKLQTFNFKKLKKSSHFFFFFGILLLSPTFNNAKYDSAHDAIKENMHLFPNAIAAIIRCADTMFEDLADRTPSNPVYLKGIETMLSTLRSIIHFKQASNDNSAATSITVMASLFPKAIPSIPYATIDAYFPSRTVNHAHSDAAFEQANRPITQM
ncbi:hypothetical protein TVAG_466780 [Trichomonas vaginalis G3]|uniref:Uncharacterized protein n=1 Tax=Trichomonas vaginalis (strain ATCC PRA-98 / G3) TaxID=412133 RepID=A2FLA4_TRIV3|nr:NCK-associateD protein 1 family [Trichomonas vaginalis G3]EAX94320.1 hypothetical protein TVAG_466780 [Trichomonas vaginalis G3]KAI5533509.1 NCK-associateD protein 1 family [Trichomonas vaginalis G3]|eukprot:XP_001307250.1 hypothetical protein [Trichomonas vaginalis G3]